MRNHMRSLCFLALGFAVAIPFIGTSRAQGTDPNNVPHDPHPLAPVASEEQGAASSKSMVVDGTYIYVLQGSELYRIDKNNFRQSEVRSVVLR